MKKLNGLLLTAFMLFALAACGSQGNQDTPVNDEPAVQQPAASVGDSNVLIVYFSVMEDDGVDTVGGASRVAVNGELMGNNEYIAALIQQETGCDLFRIETQQEYPTTHKPLLEFAHQEGNENARPALATELADLENYDTIFLGYPIWNADLPMSVYTFLESYDFSGKTIVPFTVHGGSGFAGTIQVIASLEPNATVVEDGLSISRNNVSDVQSDVTAWVEGLNR